MTCQAKIIWSKAVEVLTDMVQPWFWPSSLCGGASNREHEDIAYCTYRLQNAKRENYHSSLNPEYPSVMLKFDNMPTYNFSPINKRLI